MGVGIFGHTQLCSGVIPGSVFKGVTPSCVKGPHIVLRNQTGGSAAFKASKCHISCNISLILSFHVFITFCRNMIDFCIDLTFCNFAKLIYSRCSVMCV